MIFTQFSSLLATLTNSAYSDDDDTGAAHRKNLFWVVVGFFGTSGSVSLFVYALKLLGWSTSCSADNFSDDCQGRIDHLYCVCGSSSQSQEEDGEPILDVCWETFQHDYNYMAQLMGCATPSSSTQATPLVAALCVAASVAHFRG